MKIFDLKEQEKEIKRLNNELSYWIEEADNQKYLNEELEAENNKLRLAIMKYEEALDRLEEINKSLVLLP